jgi:hypothetical protein
MWIEPDRGDRASLRRRHRLVLRLRCAVILMLAGLTAARAGGQMTFGDDTNTSANDGPPFFGFVRDADGSAVADAKVTAAVKTGGAVVTTTNTMGIYKFPGFAKNINPNDIVISCDKSGYKQANVVRRPSAPGDVTDPIEVECYLQKD